MCESTSTCACVRVRGVCVCVCYVCCVGVRVLYACMCVYEVCVCVCWVCCVCVCACVWGLREGVCPRREGVCISSHQIHSQKPPFSRTWRFRSLALWQRPPCPPHLDPSRQQKMMARILMLLLRAFRSRKTMRKLTSGTFGGAPPPQSELHTEITLTHAKQARWVRSWVTHKVCLAFPQWNWWFDKFCREVVEVLERFKISGLSTSRRPPEATRLGRIQWLHRRVVWVPGKSLMCWCVDVLMCWCIGVLMTVWCIDVLLCWCADVLMCWCVIMYSNMHWCWIDLLLIVTT